MSVDLRRFDYALEPLRRRRQWQLEALQASLGRVHVELERVSEELATLRKRHEDESQRLARGLTGPFDPVGHGRALRWLAKQFRSIRVAEDRLVALWAERARFAQLCLAQQQQVDVLDRHREECVADFVQEESGRMSAEADRDWLVRRWAGAPSREQAPGEPP